MSLSYRAAIFAKEAHKHQVRKYTGVPYWVHLTEVAGIFSTVIDAVPEFLRDAALAACWLHDTIEDCSVSAADLDHQFGSVVADAVMYLSDLEEGNRVERKAATRARLAGAPGWVQTIKCADLISNTSSIVIHDPKFAVTYLAEKGALLAVLTKADPRLREWARSQT